MKKILSFISVFTVFIGMMSFSAYAVNNVIIDDAADLFSETEELQINDKLMSFSLETDYPAIVLTTEYAQGKTAQDYADDYFDNLVLYEGWEQEGILLLIDMDNREVCISTMGECINVYSGSIDYIIDSGYNEIVNGYYADCILLMIDAAQEQAEMCSFNEQYTSQDEYYEEYRYDSYYNNDYGYISESRNNGISLSNILICIIISFIIGIISVFIVKSQYKNMGKGDEFDADDVILNLTGSNDTVISKNVITTRVPKNNSHHRPGGSSSGGVTHRSSGGFSHGGGGRKF